MDIYKAAGILIQNRRLLVTKSFNKDIFVSPGGKLEPGETSRQALIRELQEELHLTVGEPDLTEFGNFSAPAAGNEANLVHMTVFLVAHWTGDLAPGREIESLAWVDSVSAQDIQIGSIFKHDVIPRLVASHLID